MWLGSGHLFLAIVVGLCLINLTKSVGSEDASCSFDTFQCKTEIFHGYRCIPLNWKCDGDKDCPDGDDESANCSIPTCASWQFSCQKGAVRCISRGYLCDGEEDCDDGSDETLKVCEKHKSKGTHDRGQMVDNFQCLPNQYQCPGTRHCIPIAKVCDSFVDCMKDASDEGAHCVNHGCQTQNCSGSCKETLQGPQCYCEKGFAPKGTSCQDFNECQYDGFCDQICHNEKGKFTCDCTEGYTLESSSRCTAINGDKATILIANNVNILHRKITGQKLSKDDNIAGHQILALDFDYKNKSFCWITLLEQNGDTIMECSALEDHTIGWNITTHYKLASVQQIAKDWVSGNWYFADDKKERIFLCSSDGFHCLTVINTGIRRPKSIAVDPPRGLLFYADWSTQAKIARANLDGSDRKELITMKIVHPNGLTLDYANQHVYWADSFLDIIERVNYDGKQRRIVSQATGLQQRYGLTLFENHLYVSNHQMDNKSIVRIHRFDSTEQPKVIVGNLTKPGALQIVHQVRQPEVEGDICKTKNCSQICIPVPKGTSVAASCICQAGYQLKEDTKCEKVKLAKFLLYANAQQGSIHGIAMDANIKHDVMEPIENLNRPVALGYHAKSGYIYYSDVSMLRIGRRKMDTYGEASVFLNSGVTSCEGLAIDWVGNNLFWTDDDHRTINVVRLNNTKLIHTIDIGSLNHPKAITVDPNEGYMYWTDWVLRPSSVHAKIEKAAMDGSNRKAIVEKDIQWPNSLTLDYITKKLYWTDAFFDRIESVNVNGTERQTILTFKTLNHPYGIAVFENSIFWTESLSGSVNIYNIKLNTTSHLRSVSTPLFDLIIFNEDAQVVKENRSCSTNNGDCSDICLSVPVGRVCRCGKGRRLKSDNLTCEDDPNFTPAPICDKNYKFQCKDGSCINRRLVCDGDRDCLDGSDEDTNQGGACSNVTCPDVSMFKCENKRCIYQQFVCDGEPDCIDGGDEHLKICNDSRSCPKNFSRCINTQRCIPESWLCDHENDCPHGSDEGNHCGYTTCQPNQFQCGNNRCIPFAYRCDNEIDCPDQSDEMDCGQWCDPQREFKCKNSSLCLPKMYRCDGEFNCKGSDHSDEEGCTKREALCHQSEFACDNGNCITNVWKCDGDKDCQDGSDEKYCPGNVTKTCHPELEFRCTDGQRCIPNSWKCDRDADCKDNSDEQKCSHLTPCEAPNFSCHSNGNICLPPEKLCDNKWDCPDHSDEGRLCVYDLCINSDCSHTCHKSPDGFVCSCPIHKKLRADNRTCVDINICDTWGICSQNCSSMIGPHGYTCLCYPGYQLEDDFFSCKPTDLVPAYIIYSNRHEIRRYNLGENIFVSLVSGLRNTIALDFYYEKQWIFWTDVVDDKIYRGTMISNTLTDIKAIIDVGLATTEGLAIDWIAENIYWVESNLDQIEVAKLDGTFRSTLVAGQMTSPRAIVLDPREGMLFWTDWDGMFPRIESCSMNGKNRKIIFNITKVPRGGWPNGLAVDYEARRLYWVDARSDSVHTLKYSGEDHRLILQSHETLAHPFALTVFEHFIYWTDWQSNCLVRANKFNGSDVHIIQRTFTQPFDLQIFHPKRQPPAINPCGKNNGGCSDLCLIGFNHTAHCQCSHRRKLLPDGKTCKAGDKFLLFVKENEIRGVDLNNAHYNVIPSITVPFVENASAIDYDTQEDKLYWTDIKRNVIRSAYLNGTGVETIIDSGITNPFGFAIDWLSRNMYFSSYDETRATISVAKLNGAFRTEIVTSTSQVMKIKLQKPNSIAIHPGKGLMFWSDLGGNKHRIVRAQMDGSQQKVIYEDAADPASLTVDVKSNKLYWISRGRKLIYSCNLDGNCSPYGDKVQSPVAMTIYNNTIYLANSSNIIKIDKDNHKPISMRDKTPHVYAMQVYDRNSRKDGTNGCKGTNGQCEQMCLPTGANTRICKCTAGFEIDSKNNTQCNGIKSFLLYSVESEIRGFSLAHPHAEALASVSKISLAAAVDFHADSDSIYWVDSNSRTISSIKRDLTSRKTIIDEGISGVEGMAIDWIAGNIYWTDRGHDTIEVSKLDGSNRYVVLHGDMDKPRSIVVHPKLGYMFFSDCGKNPKIIRARLDGSQREDFINQSIKAPFGITIDYESDYLYWCDKDLDVIEKVSIKHGMEDRKVIVSSNITDCMSLTVFEEFIYWADATDSSGSIKRALKTDGSEVKVLKQKLNNKLKDIKVFDTKRQQGSNPCQKNEYCEGLCLYAGDSNVTCACSYGRLNTANGTCDDYDAFLLYSKVTAIESIHMTDESDWNAPVKPIRNKTNMKNVIGLAFDHASHRIFFSDIQRGDIQTVFFNGSGVKVLVKAVGAAEGLAYDFIGNELYWTSYTNSSISKISFNDGLVGDKYKIKVLIQLSGNDHPRAIVIDSCNNHMFWTNWNDRKPSIQRAYLGGYKAESIITDNIRTPNGLTIDHKAQKLYWTDARLDKIERCDFDGTSRFVIVTAIPQHSFGIAVYGNFIYWTDWMLRAVLRANKYDGTGLTWLRKGIQRQPMGIIAVANDTNDCTANPCDNFGCEETCEVNVTGIPMCKCEEKRILLPDGKRCAAQKLICEMNDFLCEDNNRCISIEKTCNGIIDCQDASDERNKICNISGQPRKCPAGFFACKNHRCIGNEKVCNGADDCNDASDEEQCPCKENEFQCKNKMCILKKYRCDRDSDCSDHSDEIGCINLTCKDLEIEGEKLVGLVSCNTTSACIYPSWVCDGSNDCWDNSDEANCSATSKCPDGAFHCASGSCVPPQWQCDKDDDCGDNSDEVNCTYNCEEGQFPCNDSTCLPNSWRCDNHPDCPDGSDEVGCDNITCHPDEYRCPKGRCIPVTWKCDLDTDCDDGTDETEGCLEGVCKQDEFQCLNRRCIRAEFYCNGDEDCGDGSDEPETCVKDSCGPNEFKCVDRGKCIPKNEHCNGFFDCPDHSDEMNCTARQPCGSRFQCHNGVCIDEDAVCNDHNDCGDNSDEPPECNVNECWSPTRVCHQVCNNMKIGYKCGCHPGYKLNSDNKTCSDIDECMTSYPCSHFCTNTVGSFHCSCPPNFHLERVNKLRCKVSLGPEPVLLVSNRYYIRKVTIPSSDTILLTDKLTNSVAIDFDWEEQYIYWTDITSINSSINRLPLNRTENNKSEVLHSTTVRNPDGLAVDWVGRNLYWCDKTTDTIEVSKLNGRLRKVLVRKGLQEPRGLEVFPAKGLLFFTDWGDNPHISRMWMDGTHVQTVIKDNLAWPNALTIDYYTEKIFWADASLDYIGMADLDGSKRRIVVGDVNSVPHVFALSTFEDYIFWSDWERMGVYYADKFSGANVKKLTSLVHRPMDIQVAHPLRQLPVKDHDGQSLCQDNGGCSHLCLLRPVADEPNADIEYICACPEDHYLAADKRTCISNCTSAQFLCNTTSKCIPFWWRCDNHSDCEDSSDEPHTCPHYYCSQAGLFQCKNAASSEDCKLPTMICDGKMQCADGSDEEPCELYPCMDHQIKCHADKKCIPKVVQCDGRQDCSDGEDEINCTQSACNDNHFTCNNSRCVPYVWRCDNDNDCEDGSDEPPDCKTLQCKEDHIKCNKSGRCIPKAWTCDGDPDCGDHDDTDENYGKCHALTCDPTYFKCDNGHCIPGRWRCDYYDDCRDGSDEKGCTPRNCSESEVKCDNGRCILSDLYCNGEVNCEDGSDEKNCNITCQANQFRCQKLLHCIPENWKCDGDIDCADGTDEWDCNRNCSKEEFRCDNSICQPLLWRCDGQDDCGDNSDENAAMCAKVGCAPGRVRCNNSVCIWVNMICDGNQDCSDGSDELNCPASKCDITDFKCKTVKQCIPSQFVCDGRPNCEDKSDEEQALCSKTKPRLSCNISKGGCDQICMPVASGVLCHCKDGYKLASDGFSCIATNPCLEWGLCSQKCKYTANMKHYCYCEEGFKRGEGVQGPCTAKGDSPILLVAKDLTLLWTKNISADVVKPVHGHFEENENHIIAMDVDTSEDNNWKAFVVTKSQNTWFVTPEVIPKKSQNKRQKRETMQEALWFGHQKINGIALDWVMKRIYWTDATTKSIQLRNYDGKQHMHIIENGLDQPHSIAVDPESGKIFWTDQGNPPKIGSANLDGSNQTILVSTGLGWPNGIAVDHENGWVYWCDTKKYTIETMNLEGQGRRVIKRLNATDPPYTLEVFEDFLYVLTYRTFSIIRFHKFGDKYHSVNNLHTTPYMIYTGLEKVSDLVILQENKLKAKVLNNCTGSKPKCPSGLCFNNPSSERGYSCRCPKNAWMEDQKCSFERLDHPCLSFVCKNSGNCSKTIHDKAKCSCLPRFTGDHCEIDRCQDFCLNRGTCIPPSTPNASITCRCPRAYNGTRCEKYVCNKYCLHYGFCFVEPRTGNPKCNCPIGYDGDRCENKKDLVCNEICESENYKNCTKESSGYHKCICKPGFFGKRCERCRDRHCHRGGVCYKENEKSKCRCAPDFDPESNCWNFTCKYLCLQDPSHKNCNCKTKVDVCKNYCQNGTCNIGKGGEPKCICGKYFSGKKCEECTCEPGGSCVTTSGKTKCICKAEHVGTLCDKSCKNYCVNGQCEGCHLESQDKPVCKKCICKQDFSGTTCENLIHTPEKPEKQKSSSTLVIIIPALVCLFLVIVIVTFLYYRRRKRLHQYGHKRMKEPNCHNVKNPIYLRHDEDAEEQEPLERNIIFRGDASTNFANPMYDVYNTESTHMLLNQDNEEHQLLEDGLSVRYFGTGENTKSKKTSFA